MRMVRLFFVLLLFANFVYSTPTSWIIPTPIIQRSASSNRDTLLSSVINISFNYTSGEIENFCFANDPESGYCFNLLGTTVTNSNSWAGTFDEIDLQAGGSGVKGGTSALMLHHTNFTYGQNNEVCSYIGSSLNFIRYECVSKDTTGATRATTYINVYPTYYEVESSNVSAPTGNTPYVSVNTDWINASDTDISFDYTGVDPCGCNGVVCQTSLVDPNSYSAGKFYLWENTALGSPLGRSNSACTPSPRTYRYPMSADFITTTSKIRVGWDNTTISNSRAIQLNSSSTNQIASQTDGCVPDISTNYGFITQVCWGGSPGYSYSCGNYAGNIPQYFTERAELSNLFSSCSSNPPVVLDSYKKIWKVDKDNPYSGLVEINRSYYLNASTLVFSAPEGITGNSYLLGISSRVYFQTDPITAWYNRTWTKRLVLNITPTFTAIYPEAANVSANISSSLCPGSVCTQSSLAKWRLVNDMFEPIDFVIVSYGSTAMIYFQAYQMYAGNSTSYYLYGEPNETVADRNLGLGNESVPTIQNFTYSHMDTIIEQTITTANVPASVGFNDYFTVTADYVCNGNPWGSCVPGTKITEAICTFTTLSGSTNLTYNAELQLYIGTFQTTETPETVVWSVTCSKTQYETTADSGSLEVVPSCGWGEGGIGALVCSTSGVKGFFMFTGPGFVYLLSALFAFSFIVTMFSIIPRMMS